MKPVLIQVLFNKMKGSIKLPDPPSTDDTLKRDDKAGQIILAVFVIAIIACFIFL